MLLDTGGADPQQNAAVKQLLDKNPFLKMFDPKFDMRMLVPLQLEPFHFSFINTVSIQMRILASTVLWSKANITRMN